MIVIVDEVQTSPGSESVSVLVITVTVEVLVGLSMIISEVVIQAVRCRTLSR